MGRAAFLAGAAALLLLTAAPVGAAQPRATIASAAHSSATADLDELVRAGLRYEHAEGVPRDLGKAVALFCEASMKGSPEAAYELGIMRLNGRGIAQSDGKAVYWFEIARSRQHAHAGRLLARLRAQRDADATLCTPAYPSMPQAKLTAPADISRLVANLAAGFDLDPDLVTAVIAVESGFRADAVSPKNAQGLMQLIPATAARFGVSNTFDPVENIRGGMMYLRFLLRRFDGDVTLALAAYNAGEGAVIEYGGVPPYRETQLYLEKLRRYYDRRHHPVPDASSGAKRAH